MHVPEFLECTESAQRLGARLFKPVLSIPNPSLLIHRPGQKVRVVDRVRFGALDVSLSILEFALLVKHVCQGEIYPKQLADHVKSRGNSQGNLEMVGGILRISPGSMYFAENAVTLANPNFLALLQEKIDCA